jgi:hypothetical protein
MPNNRNLKDASLTLSKALPNGVAATATDGVDLQNSPKGDFVAPVEFKLSIPALTTTEQPDDKVLTYTVETDTDPAFGSATTVMTLGTQLGAGGAGAAAAEFRFVLPSGTERHVRCKATGSDTGDSSTKSMTFEVLS